MSQFINVVKELEGIVNSRIGDFHVARPLSKQELFVQELYKQISSHDPIRLLYQEDDSQSGFYMPQVKPVKLHDPFTLSHNYKESLIKEDLFVKIFGLTMDKFDEMFMHEEVHLRLYDLSHAFEKGDSKPYNEFMLRTKRHMSPDLICIDARNSIRFEIQRHSGIINTLFDAAKDDDQLKDYAEPVGQNLTFFGYKSTSQDKK